MRSSSCFFPSFNQQKAIPLILHNITQEIFLSTKGTKGVSALHFLPEPPAFLASFMTATKGHSLQIFQRLQTKWAIVKVVQQFKLRFDIPQDSFELIIVRVCLHGHLINEPAAFVE